MACARSDDWTATTTSSCFLTNQHIAQHDRFIMRLVARRKNQGEIPLRRDCAQLGEVFGMPAQLGPVSAAELVPAAWIMREPAAQLGAGRHLLQPPVDGGVRFAHATRPQTINENADAVVR